MHSPLEQYLEQVETRLRDLPAEQRQSEVEEMRQHMQDSVNARVELGYSQDEAVAHTLEQFGKARTVGVELARVHERKDAELCGNLLSAAVCAYIFNVSISLVRNWLMQTLFIPPTRMGSMILFSYWWLASLIIVPLLIGWTTAMLFPRKAVQGTALSYLIACGYSLVTSSFYSSLPANVPSDMRVRLFAQALIVTLISMLIAVASAKMGVLWRKARQRRMRLA